MFLFQFVVMMGVFLVSPLPLRRPRAVGDRDRVGSRRSITMLVAAAGVPRFFPWPRRVEWSSSGSSRSLSASSRWSRRWTSTPPPAIVTVPLLVIGLGSVARLAARGGHRLGGPRRVEPRGRRPSEHGLQFGASIGTALAGAILITALTASFLSRHGAEPGCSCGGHLEANVELANGIPFISDADLEAPLEEAGESGGHPGRGRRERAGPVGRLRSALALLALSPWWRCSSRGGSRIVSPARRRRPARRSRRGPTRPVISEEAMPPRRRCRRATPRRVAFAPIRAPRNRNRCAMATRNSTEANSTVSRTYLLAVSRAAVPASKYLDACAFSLAAFVIEGFEYPGMAAGPGGASGSVNGSVASHSRNASA